MVSTGGIIAIVLISLAAAAGLAYALYKILLGRRRSRIGDIYGPSTNEGVLKFEGGERRPVKRDSQGEIVRDAQGRPILAFDDIKKGTILTRDDGSIIIEGPSAEQIKQASKRDSETRYSKAYYVDPFDFDFSTGGGYEPGERKRLATKMRRQRRSKRRLPSKEYGRIGF